jgi:hypothetical protein
LSGYFKGTSHVNAAIVMDGLETESVARHDNGSVHRLTPRMLRPGMKLKEDIYFKDGTLLLSSGQTLSELSINRINDLEVLLPASGISIQA